MSKLKEVEFEGTKGWQWEDGPIFVYCDNARKLAIDYGKTLMRLADFEELARNTQAQHRCRQQLEQLEALREKQP